MNRLPLLVASSAVTFLSACTLAPASDPETKEPTTTTIEKTAQWQAAPDGAFGEMAVASAGDEGAIAYAESEGWNGEAYAQTRIKLQRLDNAGAIRGPAVELGVIPIDGASRMTIATDGSRYIACWADHNDKISCATAPIGQGNASPGFSTSGRWPSLAYGPGGWALAYSVMEHVVVVRMADDGTPAGDAVLFDGSASRGLQILSATTAGFVLLVESADAMRVHHLDNIFLPVTAPIDLGKGFWFHASMAVSGASVAVSLAKPYGADLFVLEQKTITAKHDLSGGGKGGLNAVLGADGDTFGMLSAGFHSGLHYGLIEEGGSSPPTEGTLENGYYDSGSLAILNLKGDMFLAATRGSHYRGGEVVVARARRSLAR